MAPVVEFRDYDCNEAAIYYGISLGEGQRGNPVWKK
jgi:hypothetical protein